MPPIWPPKSWPALIVGIILLIYWLRVLMMVRRTRKNLHRSAHLVPPEPLGRLLRLIWAPAVVIWVLHPLVTGLLAPQILPLRNLYHQPWLQWPAVAVAVLAFAATWVCWRNMGDSWRMGIDPTEKTRLVFTGPFAYVRHPIYGLSSLLMIATMIAVPSPVMLLVGVTHILLLQWEVRREDRYLVAVHGQAYRDYQSKVGRFLPRSLRAYRPDSPVA